MNKRVGDFKRVARLTPMLYLDGTKRPLITFAKARQEIQRHTIPLKFQRVNGIHNIFAGLNKLFSVHIAGATHIVQNRYDFRFLLDLLHRYHAARHTGYGVRHMRRKPYDTRHGESFRSAAHMASLSVRRLQFIQALFVAVTSELTRLGVGFSKSKRVVAVIAV